MKDIPEVQKEAILNRIQELYAKNYSPITISAYMPAVKKAHLIQIIHELLEEKSKRQLPE